MNPIKAWAKDLIGLASPYMLWIKLALVAAIFAGGAYVGKHWEQNSTLKCEVGRANDATVIATTVVTGVAKTGEIARAKTDEGSTEIRAGHERSARNMEKVDALPEGHSLGSNAALRAWLDGL